MGRPLLVAAVFFAAVWPAVARAADPATAALDKAKAAYEAELEKYRAAVAAYFDAREETARKAGDKKAVDGIKAERQMFTAKGDLPKTAPATLKQKLTSARATLEAAYETAVKEYTRAKQDDEAAAAEKALAAFKAGGPAPKPKVFEAGSVLTGKLTHGKIERPITVTVTKTKPADDMKSVLFEATLEWAEGTRVLKMKFSGERAGAKVSMTAVEILSGKPIFPVQYKGTLDGPTFKGTWSATKGDHDGTFNVKAKD